MYILRKRWTIIVILIVRNNQLFSLLIRKQCFELFIIFCSQEADIGVGPFTVTAARETVVDFLTPFQEEGVGIIMKTKDQKNDRMFRMFLPFQSTSWIATGVSIVITGIILFVISRCSPYTNNADKPIYKNFWLAFGAFFGQRMLCLLLDSICND